MVSGFIIEIRAGTKMYRLKRIIRKILRFLRFAPAIYHWEPWDFCYTYELMEYIFSELHNFYNNPKNVHIADSSRLRIAKEIFIAKNLLKRLRENEYHDPEFIAFKKPEWLHHPLPDNKGIRVEFKFDSEEHEKTYRIMMARHFEREARLQKQDLDYFGKIFKKTPGWWD